MSNLPQIDTFEYDISEEIKSKGVSIRDIASASGTVENKPEPSNIKSSSIFIILSIFFLFLGIAVIIWYMIFIQNQNKALNTNRAKDTTVATTTNSSLQNTLPSLNENVGRFISKIDQTSSGYDLTLDKNNYSQVFAYIIKNENSFAQDTATLFNITLDASTSTNFIDQTIMNQNMRVLNNGSSTIAYAFINTDHLVLSTSTEGVLNMRSAIIK